ncbi:hypothetical protein EVAR_847_1 [Eumeta japonica]|uniref:Uncharacterized protein n=1 Tax=Eumeta variegata TaxID=151549 RepID=A0A4C1SDH2_EUMVA|nr:hypothetical protein EVAR_847_1 [Eumeta japonica]
MIRCSVLYTQKRSTYDDAAEEHSRRRKDYIKGKVQKLHSFNGDSCFHIRAYQISKSRRSYSREESPLLADGRRERLLGTSASITEPGEHMTPGHGHAGGAAAGRRKIVNPTKAERRKNVHGARAAEAERPTTREPGPRLTDYRAITAKAAPVREYSKTIYRTPSA